MLILVGVTINLATNGGLFAKARNVKLDTQKEVDRENLLVALMKGFKENGDFDIKEVSLPNDMEWCEEEDTEYIQNREMSVKEEGCWVMTKSNNKFYVNGNGDLLDANNIKVLVKTSDNEDSGKYKLKLSHRLENTVGTWKSEDNSIVTVDNEGNIEWKCVGITNVIYYTEDESEKFYIVCKYAIEPKIDGWSISDNIGKNGTSSSDSQKREGILEWSNNRILSSCTGNFGVYNVTMYRKINLTNVSKIKYKGYYFTDEIQNIKGYESGIVDINKLNNGILEADCEFKENYYHQEFVSQKENYFEITHDTKDLEGEYLIAFKATHPNATYMTGAAGYQGEILLEP